MVNKLKTLGIAVAAASAVATASVAGPPKTVTVTGLWNNKAPITDYSVPGEVFAVSFDIPQNFTYILKQPDLIVTTDFSNFRYQLDGTTVAGVPDNITFFDAADGGGLALGFSGKDASSFSVEFFGPDIGSTGILKYGPYTGYPSVEFQYTGTSVNEGTALMSVVPEPAAWATMIVGFGLAGAAVRGSRRKFGRSRQAA